MNNPQICLASSSPRRRELLDQIGVSYRVLEVVVSERMQDGESPADHVQRLALEKARAGWETLDAEQRIPVLGADTIVVLGGTVFGKPSGKDEGLAMLEQLSGRSHDVLSAVALVDESERIRLCTSKVQFRETTAAERAAYWNTGEPQDKAGAYAIQGRAAVFIARIEGSYSGVMGLPLFETSELLQMAGSG